MAAEKQHSLGLMAQLIRQTSISQTSEKKNNFFILVEDIEFHKINKFCYFFTHAYFFTRIDHVFVVSFSCYLIYLQCTTDL